MYIHPYFFIILYAVLVISKAIEMLCNAIFDNETGVFSSKYGVFILFFAALIVSIIISPIWIFYDMLKILAHINQSNDVKTAKTKIKTQLKILMQDDSNNE